MKKIISACFILAFASSAFCRTAAWKNAAGQIAESKSGKKEFVQSIWTVIKIDYEANKALFYPHNEYMVGYDQETRDFENKLLEEHSKAYKTNLYNIVFKHILRGELTVYYASDPMWYDTKDKGYLHFPINAENFSFEKKKAYANDSILKYHLKKDQILGTLDYSYAPVPLESIEFPGEDSMRKGIVVYYERECVWYTDKDILAYQLREELVMDENGQLVNRRIKAIAPMVNAIDFSTGEIYGTKELFWIDFEELNLILKNYYVLLDGVYERKVKSFSQIFKERIFISNVIEQDSSFVTPSK